MWDLATELKNQRIQIHWNDSSPMGSRMEMEIRLCPRGHPDWGRAGEIWQLSLPQSHGEIYILKFWE